MLLFKTMIYSRILWSILMLRCLEAKESCRDRITAKFPNAKCVDVDNLDDCKAECEHLGEKQCKGKRGEISKLNCKDGSLSCCCDIHCEHNNVTLIRLDQALKESSIIQNSHLCVTADKSEIKEKLKEACRQEEKVQIARQYCLEEHEGKYYCLKDGKCFGHLCKGCIKHECEVQGQKKIMNPPESYIQEALESGFTYDPEVAETINVDDHSELNHLREWCTQVPNRQDRTFQEECLTLCTQLGHALCNAVPEKIEPTNDCKGNQAECQCCCQPSCDESRRVNCTHPTPEITTQAVTEEEDCAEDGFAEGYDDSQEIKSGASARARNSNWKENPGSSPPPEEQEKTTTTSTAAGSSSWESSSLENVDNDDAYVDYSYEEEEMDEAADN